MQPGAHTFRRRRMAWKVRDILHTCTPSIANDLYDSYVPYKYAMEKFVNVGSISKDHIDPSIFCVLTAKSKQRDVPLADFLIFSPRWDVATGTFRPPVRLFEHFLSNKAEKCTISITIGILPQNSWD